MTVKPQPIFLNGRFITQQITGVQRFAWSMLTAMDRVLADEGVAEGIEFILLLPEPVDDLPALRAIRVEHHPGVPGQLWEQTTLPWICRDGLLINFCNRAPLLKSEQIVVVHDAAVVSAPAGFSASFRASYRFLFSTLALLSRSIVTVSEYSRHELTDRLGFNKDVLRVIYPGADHMLAVESDPNVRKFGLTPGGYALLVGSLQPNKNIAAVETAFAGEEPPFDIAIAGGRNHTVFRGTGATASNRIKPLGYVTDAELRGLYENAGCFILPSLYEGFGLPALEAMMLGCPVVTSKAAALPEACGEAALYFDPSDPEAIRKTVSTVMGSPLLQQELAQRGRARAAEFTWNASATALLQLVGELTSRRVTGSNQTPFVPESQPFEIRATTTAAC
jgi:glycosyltransferase involved in cell wall biosynthesis